MDPRRRINDRYAYDTVCAEHRAVENRVTERELFGKRAQRSRRKTVAVRAKFKCTQKTPQGDVRLEAVTAGSPENESWAKYTPAGTLMMRIDNPNATEQIEEGKSYYLDISPADAD